MFNGAQGAVSLTYDDGMTGHLDAAMPDLEGCSLRGTFYVNTGWGGKSPWIARAAEWAAGAARGHEIGNHTVRHPCRGKGTVTLCDYTHQQIADEIAKCEADIAAVAGKQTRSFAYPCCHSTVGPDEKQVSYIDAVERLCPAARMGGGLLADPKTVDLMQVPSMPVLEGVSLEQVVGFIDQAIATRQWAVLMFHGVGEGWLVVDRPTHQGICRAVAERVANGRLYCGTFVEMAMRIRGGTGRPWTKGKS